MGRCQDHRKNAKAYARALKKDKGRVLGQVVAATTAPVRSRGRFRLHVVGTSRPLSDS